LIGRQLKLPWLLLVFLVHPFVWYCTNEARPYALQICAGAWLLYGIILLGFSGLGPPRNELRELVRGGDSLHLFLRQCHLPGLIALALTCFAAIGKCWLARRDRMIQLLTLFLSAYGGLIFLVCLIMRFPFWGRHMAPALPFVVLLIVRLL